MCWKHPETAFLFPAIKLIYVLTKSATEGISVRSTSPKGYNLDSQDIWKVIRLELEELRGP